MVDGDLRRIPPHNLVAEQALIGAVLARNSVYLECDAIVAPEDFADPLHGRIWAAIGALVDMGVKADFLTLRPRFENDPALTEAGGATYLAKLENAVVSFIGAEDYARSVRELAVRRRAIEDAKAELVALYDDHERPAAEILADRVAAIQRRRAETTLQARSKLAVAERVYARIDKPTVHYKTGLACLDESLGGGLHAGRLYALAARMKRGKTAFLGTISHNLNARRIPHLYLCLEVDAEEVEQRNIARVLGVPPIDVMHGRFDRERLAHYIATAPDYAVYEDVHGCTLVEIRARIADAVVRHKITGFILDYWQLVRGRAARDSEESHLREIADTLADMCRRHGLWGLVAAQVNQDGNTRGGEGLKLSCDWYGTLNRLGDSHHAWINVELCRYHKVLDVGTEEVPALWMHYTGPWFQDIADVDMSATAA